ncbi:hypothetical protein TISLANDTSLP1_16920 [Thermodesulfovibrio yellowstonii]|uniref:Uncharacterized protein n=1 Tax=Thermodesulfovibrio yellowstonii TaxID=28262 RepID=A0A9W6GHI7_9BACT|nr:hypothetical protein TISLANDTSLP1_16920 [Thermodesulfovibrio islandicus]
MEVNEKICSLLIFNKLQVFEQSKSVILRGEAPKNLGRNCYPKKRMLFKLNPKKNYKIY